MSLISETSLLTARILRRWSGDAATVAQSLLFPAFFLVALDVLLGDGVKRVTGQSALYGSVPLVSLIGATSGAIIVAVGVMRERDDGLLARFWVVPSRSCGATKAPRNSDTWPARQCFPCLWSAFS
jgi:ABC-2 type transport system permease protein